VLHSFDGGLRTLITGLAEELGDSVRTGVAVQSIRPATDGGFDVAWESDATGTRVAETLHADAVVVATPGYAATNLVAGWDDVAARALEDIPVAPVSVLCLGYERGQVGHPLDGFGGVFPRSEGLRTLGVIFTSSIFTGRARDGHVLLRVMIGGAKDPGIADLSPDETIAAVRAELDPLLSIGSPPPFSRVYQHRLGIPQYELGHLDRVAAVDALEGRYPGLYFTGNSLRGIAMNSCVKDAWRVGAGVVNTTGVAAPDRVTP
jgi:oxygen-dependent protoporphyrinogen oxidase